MSVPFKAAGLTGFRGAGARSGIIPLMSSPPIGSPTSISSLPGPGNNLPSPSTKVGWAGDGGSIDFSKIGNASQFTPTSSSANNAGQVAAGSVSVQSPGMGAIWNQTAGQYDPQMAYYTQQHNSALGLGNYMQGYYGQQAGFNQAGYQSQLAKLGLSLDANNVDRGASSRNLGIYSQLAGALGGTVAGLPTIQDLYASELQNKLGQIDLDTLKQHQNLDWNTQFGTAGQTIQQGQITQSGEQQKEAARLATQEQQQRANMEGWRLDMSRNNEQATLDKLDTMAKSIGIDKNILAQNFQESMAKLGLSQHTDMNKIFDMASSADMNIAALGNKIIAEVLQRTQGLTPDQIRELAGIGGGGQGRYNPDDFTGIRDATPVNGWQPSSGPQPNYSGTGDPLVSSSYKPKGWS